MLPCSAFADAGAGAAQVSRPAFESSPWRALTEAGFASDSSSARLGVQYDFAPLWQLSQSLALSASLELTAGYWRINKNAREEQSGVSQVGLTPTLRLAGPSRTGFFAEIGIGANAISPRLRSTATHLSTNYQFGDHLGVGWRAPGRAGWEIGLRYEHFSNAGIKKPNPGIGFTQLRLSTGF